MELARARRADLYLFIYSTDWILYPGPWNYGQRLFRSLGRVQASQKPSEQTAELLLTMESSLLYSWAWFVRTLTSLNGQDRQR